MSISFLTEKLRDVSIHPRFIEGKKRKRSLPGQRLKPSPWTLYKVKVGEEFYYAFFIHDVEIGIIYLKPGVGTGQLKIPDDLHENQKGDVMPYNYEAEDLIEEIRKLTKNEKTAWKRVFSSEASEENSDDESSQDDPDFSPEQDPEEDPEPVSPSAQTAAPLEWTLVPVNLVDAFGDARKQTFKIKDQDEPKIIVKETINIVQSNQSYQEEVVVNLTSSNSENIFIPAGGMFMSWNVINSNDDDSNNSPFLKNTDQILKLIPDGNRVKVKWDFFKYRRDYIVGIISVPQGGDVIEKIKERDVFKENAIEQAEGVLNQTDYIFIYRTRGFRNERNIRGFVCYQLFGRVTCLPIVPRDRGGGGGEGDGDGAGDGGGGSSCKFAQDMHGVKAENVLNEIKYGVGKDIYKPSTNPYASSQEDYGQNNENARNKLMTEWQLGTNSNAVSGRNGNIKAGEDLYTVLTQAHKNMSSCQGQNYDAYSVLRDMCKTCNQVFNFNLYPIGYAKYVLDFECRSWYLMLFSGSNPRATWMPLEMITFLCWNHPEIMRFLKNTPVTPLTQFHRAKNGKYPEGVPYIGWNVNKHGDNRFNTISKGYPEFAMAQKTQERQVKDGKCKKCAMECFGCGARSPQNLYPAGHNQRKVHEYSESLWHEDHVVPLHFHGKDEDFNKQELCTACHDRKTRWEGALDFNSGSEPVPMLILAGHSLYAMCLYVIDKSRHAYINEEQRKKLMEMAGFDTNDASIMNAQTGVCLKQAHGSKGSVPVDFKPIATLVSGKTFQNVIDNFKWTPGRDCVTFLIDHFELNFQACSQPEVVLTWREIIDKYVNKDETSFAPNDYRPYSQGRPFGEVDGTVTFESAIIP